MTGAAGELGVGGGPHHGGVGADAGPQDLLADGLVDEHAEAVDDLAAGAAGGGEQGGLQRVVDEVGDDLAAPQQGRVERQVGRCPSRSTWR